MATGSIGTHNSLPRVKTAQKSVWRLFGKDFLPWLWVERLSLLLSKPGKGAEDKEVRPKTVQCSYHTRWSTVKQKPMCKKFARERHLLENLNSQLGIEGKNCQNNTRFGFQSIYNELNLDFIELHSRKDLHQNHSHSKLPRDNRHVRVSLPIGDGLLILSYYRVGKNIRLLSTDIRLCKIIQMKTRICRQPMSIGRQSRKNQLTIDQPAFPVMSVIT